MPTAPTKTFIETITDLLQHLVRMPTITSDHATNRAALDWVEKQLQGLPLTIRRFEHMGFSSLVATTRPTRDPKLWLAGHIDVVPGDPSSFNPHLENGKLYGRGAHDMKGGLAIFIALLQDLGSSLINYDLGLMLTSDEEVGGHDGVRWLLEQGYRGQAAFIPDSGVNWGLESGSKGIMWWDLVAAGRSAHASRPWEGLSAIDELNRFIAHVRTHLPTEPCGSSDHNHPTLNIGAFNGGEAANQVAYTARARLDIRVPVTISLETVTSWFDEAKNAIPSVEATIALADPPYSITNHSAILQFQAIAHDIIGDVPTTLVAHGSSDARHFAARGIPTVNISPVGSGFHVPREWVDLDSLDRLYAATRRFVESWAKN